MSKKRVRKTPKKKTVKNAWQDAESDPVLAMASLSLKERWNWFAKAHAFARRMQGRR